MTSMFATRRSVEQIEKGIELSPRFNEEGLIPVVVTDASGGGVLMLGFMNELALTKTISTGEAHYFSRSRQSLWRKGEISGLTHNVEQILIDDDQDAVWLRVRVGGVGASCHVGYRSCFYREVVGSGPVAPSDSSEQSREVPAELRFVEDAPAFDAEKVYAGLPNPTQV